MNAYPTELKCNATLATCINFASRCDNCIQFYVGIGVDTEKTAYFEHGEDYTYYLRILRVAYTQRSGELPPSYEAITVPRITYKTFMPQYLSRRGENAKFESFQDLFHKINTWKQHTGM